MIVLIKRLVDASGEYKGKIYLSFLFALAKSCLSKAPVVMAFIVIRQFYVGTMSFSYCLCLGLAMLVCLVLQSGMDSAANSLQSTAGYMVFAQKRLALAQHLRRLPMGYFTEGNIGKISSVLSGDMVFVESYCMTELANVMSYLFAELFMLVFLFALNIWLGLAAIFFLCVIACIAKGMRTESAADSKKRQQQGENLTGSVLEFAEGLGIIKTYNLLGEKSKDLTDNFRLSCQVSLDYEKRQSRWQRLLFVVYGVGTTAMIGCALYLWLRGYVDNMAVVGLLLFAFDLFTPVKAMYSSVSMLTLMNSSMDRIDDIFKETPLPDEGGAKIPAQSNEPEIAFQNICFCYREKEVLHKLSFKIEKNKMTALVGPSGGGKSTIANLLARFWDTQSGTVQIRGIDIRQVPISELMNHISMVFQRVYLFNDTVYNNISLGKPDASREEVIQAAKKARCYDFVMALPEGFDSIVGEGGANLSGGEKQRISIARCILKDAPIVILDEATASVDVDNERFIQEAINELCKGKTLLVIAHRLGTICHADEILVINKGTIEERGSHEDLMRKNGLYASFVGLRASSQSWCQMRLAE